ncbi:hypothetical protein, partial [Burkholderia gladioli]|uniref:hypothetical protein n=1 Tax=Burkholderia gladioli TaxID=28095 RepID=UPI001FC88C52
MTKDANGKTVRKAAAIDDPKFLECGNDTLNGWHPKQKELHLLADDPLGFSGPNLARVFRRFGPDGARQKRQLTDEFS